MTRTTTFAILTIVAMSAASTGCCINRSYCGPVRAGCDTCGEVCRGGCGVLGGCLHNLLTCGSGCGDVYYDEWASDAPSGCDSCNRSGDYCGPSACCPPLFGFLRTLWGCSYRGDCCSGGSGCCDSGHDHEWSDGEVIEDQVLEGDQPLAPTPAEVGTAIRQSAKPYYVRQTSSRSRLRRH